MQIWGTWGNIESVNTNQQNKGTIRETHFKNTLFLSAKEFCTYCIYLFYDKIPFALFTSGTVFYQTAEEFHSRLEYI